MAKWIIDKKEMRWARKQLDLTLPVRIRRTNTLQYRGMYGDSTSSRHNLNLATWQSIQEANFTLWHELGHAQQCEQEFHGESWYYNAMFRRIGYELGINLDGNVAGNRADWLTQYETHPFEQYADRVAWQYEGIPLIKSL